MECKAYFSVNQSEQLLFNRLCTKNKQTGIGNLSSHYYPYMEVKHTGHMAQDVLSFKI